MPVDLFAAYYTVWLGGLILKLKKAIPYAKITSLVKHDSVVAPTIFNLYTSDIRSRKFCYANDIAIATQSRTLGEVKATLTRTSTTSVSTTKSGDSV